MCLGTLLNERRIPAFDESEFDPTALLNRCRKVYPCTRIGIKFLPTSEWPCQVAALLGFFLSNGLLGS